MCVKLSEGTAVEACQYNVETVPHRQGYAIGVESSNLVRVCVCCPYLRLLIG